MAMITIKAKRVGQVADSVRNFEYQGFDLKNPPTLDEILSALGNDEKELIRAAVIGYNTEARGKAADPFYGLVPDFASQTKKDGDKDVPLTEDEVSALERTWRNTANGLLKLGKTPEQVKALMGV